jgi:hypothetical protein
MDARKEEIIARMCEGESLRSICRSEGFPTASAVIQWTYKDEEFAKHYAHAREAQADALFEDLAEVAEDALKAETAVEVAARRLIVDTHKWRLSKIVPKKYGEKIQTEHSGEMTVRTATDLKDDELAAIATSGGG